MSGFNLILPKLASHLESIAAMDSYNHWEMDTPSPANVVTNQPTKSPSQSSLLSSRSSSIDSQSSTRMTLSSGHSISLEYSPELAEELNFGTSNTMRDASGWSQRENGTVLRRMKKIKMASGRVLTVTQSYSVQVKLDETVGRSSLFGENKPVAQEL
jgi:hypothetical protein